MKSVLIRAKQYLPTASGAEQGALRYLLEHSEEIPQLSVKELSQRSFSSAATIVRLCKKLGFEGYRDLQKQLLFEIAVRTQEQSRGMPASPPEALRISSTRSPTGTLRHWKKR